jgi:hypothetical protein
VAQQLIQPLQKLHIEEEIEHVAVFHDVFLALGAHFSGFFGALFTLVLNEIVKRDGLRADKAAFKVGMDDASGLRCGIAFVNRPCADLFHASGEVGLQAEQIVACADQTIQTWLFLTNRLEKLGFVRIVQLGDF